MAAARTGGRRSRGVRPRACVFLLGVVAAAPAGLAAQRVPPLVRPTSSVGFAAPAAPGPRRLAAVGARAGAGTERVSPQELSPPSLLLATASSLAVPGMGQLLLGQRRWTAYAAIELGGWLVHLDRLRRGRRFRASYRDLAWTAARGMPSPRDESDWSYYEAIGSWGRSGAYDVDGARPGIQPETDGESYNGAVWALAQDLYLPERAGPEHPAYARALEYYQSRAIAPGFLWDWAGREDSQVFYRELVHESDEALRTARVVLGGVVANHLFSAVDAFISSRLGHRPPVAAGVDWRATPSGGALEWRIEVRR